MCTTYATIATYICIHYICTYMYALFMNRMWPCITYGITALQYAVI